MPRMTTEQKELPAGWKWVKLGDVADFKSGKYISKKELSPDGDVPVWGANGIIGYTNEPNYFDPTIVIGRVGAIGAINQTVGSAWITDNTICCIPREGLEWDYCVNFLGQVDFQDIRSGTSQPLIPQTKVSALPIPLPPLEEQKRIAGILNKADELKKLREEADKKTEELIPAIFHEMFGDPASSRTKWSKTTLKDLAVKIVAGKSYSTDGDVESSPYKVLKTSAVSWRVFNHNEVKALPFDYVPPKEHIVQKDDILVSRMNTEALVGASVLVPKSYPDIAIPDRLWRVVVPRDVELVNAYLWGYLNYPSTRAKITSISSGTSGSMKNISQTNFLSLHLHIPPLEIQTDFSSRLASALRVSNEQQNSYNRINELKSSLLQRAFRGEL